MDITSIVIGILIGVVAGAVIAFVLQKSALKARSSAILKEAEVEAEALKKEKILQAKERFLQLKNDHENKVRSREQKIQSVEDKVKSKEKQLSQKIGEFGKKEKEIENLKTGLNQEKDAVIDKRKEIEKLHQKQVNELSKISGLSPEEAKTEVKQALIDEARTDAMASIKDIVEEAKINANREAKKIVVQSIQRVATEQAIENSVSVFNIESDEMKGRIIGREGRNIRALEAATGVEIIDDDTPEAIILSCFDSIRREIARLSLHQLVSDGRIHPARIEDVVRKQKSL